SDKIVVSTVTGTHVDAAAIYPTNWLYVDYAVANFGSDPTSGRWWTYLYVDGVLTGTFFYDPALNPNFYTFFNDYNIGALAAGMHTLTLVADPTGVIPETDESDNSYTKTITVLGIPDLRPYQPPGWSDHIVVSSTPGTNTDAATLLSTDTLYVDWSVLNNGSAATSARFY